MNKFSIIAKVYMKSKTSPINFFYVLIWLISQEIVNQVTF